MLCAGSQVGESSVKIWEVEELFLEEVHFKLICERQRAKAGRWKPYVTPSNDSRASRGD